MYPATWHLLMFMIHKRIPAAELNVFVKSNKNQRGLNHRNLRWVRLVIIIHKGIKNLVQ